MKRLLKGAKAVILAAAVVSNLITGGFTGGLTEVNAQQSVEKLYVSNTGTATGDGSKENPYDFKTAINKSKDGMEIHLAPGVYEFSETIIVRSFLSGTDVMRRSLIADGEVIFDFSGQTGNQYERGLIIAAWNWDIKGIRIRNAHSVGMLVSGSYNVVENCVFESNGDSGLQVSCYAGGEWPKYNLIKNCTSFNNCDYETDGENADGFAAKITCGEGNVFDGCIAYNNSDDGWDLFAKPATGSIGQVTIRNCVAFRNGALVNSEGTPTGDGNGFKLGGSSLPTEHVVINCLAFENTQSGFTDNSNPAGLKLRNCTAVNNSLVYRTKNYQFSRENNGVKKNILSYKNQEIDGISTDYFNSTVDHSVCWTKGGGNRYVKDEIFISGNRIEGTAVSVTDNDFYSVLPPASTEDIHSLFRDEDGTINLHGLYEIKKASKLATMADDGGCVGSRLSNEQGFTQQESPDLRQEQYIIPAGKLEFEGDLSPDLSGGIYIEPFKYNEFTITASEAKDMVVDFVKVSYEPENLNFYKRIYFYGRGQADYRSIRYEAKEAGTISIYGNSVSLDSPRSIQLCKENGTVLETKLLPGDAIYKIDFNIPEAGNYYITSYGSGWYMYYAKFEKKKSEPDDKDSQDEDYPGDDTPGDSENSTEDKTIADIYLPCSEITLGVTSARKNVVGNNIYTMIPFVKSTDINDKVIWTVYEEGEDCAPGKSGKNAKKYLTVANGKLTAKKAGVGKTVIVKAQIKNGKVYKESATCTVKIIDDAAYTLPQEAFLTTDTTATDNTFDVNINGKGMKTAKPLPQEVLTNKGILLPVCGAIAGNSNKIKWSIDDKEEKKLASVNSAGKITARKPGTVNVTAKLGEQIIIYKVNIHTAYVELNTESDSYNAKSKNFVAPISEGINVSDCIKSVSGVDTDRNHIVYSIPSVAHQKIATIDANTGVLTPTGVKSGKITVNATINGVSAPVKINVVAK